MNDKRTSRFYIYIILIFQLSIFANAFGKDYFGGITLNLDLPVSTNELKSFEKNIAQQLKDRIGQGEGINEDFLYLTLPENLNSDIDVQDYAVAIQKASKNLKYIVLNFQNINKNSFEKNVGKYVNLAQTLRKVTNLGIHFPALKDMALRNKILDFYIQNKDAFELLSVSGGTAEVFSYLDHKDASNHFLSSLKILLINNVDVGFSNIPLLVKILNRAPNLEGLNISIENLSGSLLDKISSNLNNLTYLSFGTQNVSEIGSALNKLILLNPNLKYLNLYNAGLKGQDAQSVLEALSKIKNLVYLNLGRNFLNVNDGSNISSILSSNQNLKFLDISSNLFESKGLIVLVDALSKATSLEALSVANDFIEAEAFGALGTSLKSLKKLTYLNLSENYLEQDSSTTIIDALIESGNIAYLDAHSNNLGPTGALLISDKLGQLKQLKYLDLSDNSIRRSGGIALADAFVNLENLEYLKLRNNKFKDITTAKIIRAISNAQLLKTLDLSENALGDTGLKYLSEYIEKHNQISNLYLSNTDMSSIASRDLLKSLMKNKNLVLLDISANNIDKKSIEYIKNLVNKTESFTTLILTDNDIDCSDIENKVTKRAFKCL